jgi:hypothetical protein
MNSTVGPYNYRWFVWLGVAFFVSAALALAMYSGCQMLQCGPTRDWMPLLTPFVPISVLVVGYYIWIEQTRLKRRFEVAEKLMLVFAAASNTLEFARLDFYTDEDVKDRPRADDEDAREGRIKDRWYVVLKRLYDRRDTLIGLREAELLGALYLGAEAKSALAELSAVVATVRAAANTLMSSAREQADARFLPKHNRQSFLAHVRQCEVDCSTFAVLFDESHSAIPNSNRVNARIEAARVKLKAICGPYLLTADL